MRSKLDIEGASVKNLDEIQEDDPGARPSRLGALILASLGGACIVLAAALLFRGPAKPKAGVTDPLGDLVAKTQPAGGASARPGDGAVRDITFPGVLSDTKNTTALEAVRDARAAITAPVPSAEAGPPAAADRLPVMPLPAQSVLEATTEHAASDTLSAMAKHVSRDEGAETVGAGTPGNYQLQVSSFKTATEAEGFAAALRRRGHKAYVEPANVPGRGLWHRVRIGPFKYKHSAVIYRQDFEAKERMVTFIVDPPKNKVSVRGAGESNE